MMNSLSLAVHLNREPDVVAALETWERNERQMTDHTQRILSPAWIADDLAATAARRHARSRRRIEMADQATHPHRVTSSHRDLNLLSERDCNAVHRGVAVDQIDALPCDPGAALGLHQAMQRRATEDALAVSAEFNHDEF